MSKSINKNYFLLLIGQTVSQLGSSTTSFALVIWAYSSTGRVMASSVLAVCSFVPYLMVSLLGGAVADHRNKKRILLLCDTVAAAGSLVILICSCIGILKIWILCVVNIISGFMNAFQGPASQVAVTLLVEEKDYAKAGGMQSACNAAVGILNPILAAGLLSMGGLRIVLLIDLITFLIAFLTLLLGIQIPDRAGLDQKTGVKELWESMREGVQFIKGQKSIRYLLVLYGVLEFVGAVSFDSMYSPLLLARTGNDEAVVGGVSAVAAAGGLLASLVMAAGRQPERKLPAMFAGSLMCLCGILLFGMGRNLIWWCVVVFIGCFGSPVYQTYQTVLLREHVPVSMQGRIFSLQGMITQSLAPVGCLLGAWLADDVFEPFMKKNGAAQDILSTFVGRGNGAGMGLLFVLAGAVGILILIFLWNHAEIKALDG